MTFQFSPVKFVGPFLHKTKAQEWATAAKLGILDVIKNETVTCYNGIPGDGCGKCPACRLRGRGAAAARVPQDGGTRDGEA